MDVAIGGTWYRLECDGISITALRQDLASRPRNQAHAPQGSLRTTDHLATWPFVQLTVPTVPYLAGIDWHGSDGSVRLSAASDMRKKHKPGIIWTRSLASQQQDPKKLTDTK